MNEEKEKLAKLLGAKYKKLKEAAATTTTM
jgi:hypothetical protein